jgi:hypothetical protein
MATIAVAGFLVAVAAGVWFSLAALADVKPAAPVSAAHHAAVELKVQVDARQTRLAYAGSGGSPAPLVDFVAASFVD